MKLDEQAKEKLRTQTVEVLLDLRAAYLATPGCSPLKHWDQLQDRMRAAARTCASPEEWTTKMARDLQLASPSLGSSRSLLALVHEVTERGCRREWLDLIEREHGYLMALARLSAEQRRAAREAAVAVTEDGEVLT